MPSIQARVAASLTAVQLAPLRAERRAIGIYNATETGVLTLKLGGAPDLTLGSETFTARVLPGGRWKEETGDPVYGIWDRADGYAQVEEYL